MSDLGGLLGGGAQNDSARQLFIWGVLYGLLSAVFEPITTDITQDMWKGAVGADLHRVLSPDELANMVVRGWLDQAAGENEAGFSGVNVGDFDRMVNNRRNPIAPEEAAAAERRNILPFTAPDGTVLTFQDAIMQGNLGNDWGPVIQALAKQIPSPADVLQGVLQGQVPAGIDPVALYERTGGMAIDSDGFDWYTFMFNTRGAAPTPNEAATMALRGIIPWGDGSDGPVIEGPGAISFYQAFLEGPWRNKWETAWREMSHYLPPPRTVTAMLKQGALTVAQATDLLTKQGLTPDLVAAYINGATATKVAATKKLSEANIITLLNDKLITVADATTMLEQLGYPTNEATILATTAQAAATISDLKSNVNRVETLFVNHKIDRTNALTMLAQLGLDPTQAAQKVDDWQLLKAAAVRLLTPAQIADAWEYGVYTQAQAIQELENLGYVPFDAWTVLSIKAKQPLPNPPPFGPGIVQ